MQPGVQRRTVRLVARIAKFLSKLLPIRQAAIEIEGFHQIDYRVASVELLAAPAR